MTSIRRLILSICLPLLLLIVVIAWLLYTPSGTRQVFNLIAQQGILNYQGLDGAIGTGLNIESVTIQTDGIEATIEDFALALDLGELLKARLTLGNLQAETVTLTLKPTAQPADSSRGNPLEWLKFNQGLIPFELVVKQMSLNQLTLISGAQKWQLDAITLSSNADERGLSDTRLSLNYGSSQLQLSGTAYLFPALHADLKVDWSTPGLEGQPVYGHSDINANSSTVKLTQQTTGEISSDINLRVDNWLEAPVFKLKGNVEQLTWPGTADHKDYLLSSIRLNAEGPLEKLRTTLNAQLTIRGQQPMNLEMQAMVNPEYLAVSRLAIGSQAHGMTDVKGRLDWSKGITQWQSQVTLDNFNAHLFDNRLPTALTGTAETHGQWSDQLEFQLSSSSLKGRLHEHLFQASVQLQFANKQLDIKDLTASSGDDVLNLKGTLTDNQLAAELMLKVNDMERFYPAIKGSADVQATLSGTADAPTLTVHLLAEKLLFADVSADTLQADIQLIKGVFQPDKNTLTATKIGSQAFNANELHITAEGHWRQPQLTLQANKNALTLQMATQPKFRDEAISGILTKLSLASKQQGHWELQEPTVYQLEAQTKQLSELCLKGLEAKLCLSASLINDQIAANLNAINLPAKLLSSFGALSVPIQGNVDLQGNATGTLKNPNITLQLAQHSTSTPLVIGDADESQKRLTLKALSAEVRLQNHTLTSSAQADIDTGGYLHSTLTIKDLDKTTNPLTGEISFYLPSLEPYAQVLPDIDHLAGEFTGRIKLGNSLQQPSLQLESELAIASLYINSLAVEWKELYLKAVTQSGNIQRIEGSAKAGDGIVNLTGTVRLSAVDDWQIDLHLTGENALFMNQPHQRFIVTPDVTLRATPSQVDVGGIMRVPSAYILYQSSPQQLSLTSDAVIHDHDQQTAKPEPVAYQMDIQLQAGDDVYLEAYGLKTGLKGQLNINKPLHGSLNGRGLIELVDGSYRAYGQDLTFDRGFIQFNGALSDPILDVKASRKVSDIEAGLQIKGPVSNLKTTLFSDPAMPETEILSYILRGKSLNDSNSQEKNALSNAVLAYSIGQSTAITDRATELTGLDEIGFEAEEGVDTVGLTLGKYITPRLYVRYGIGLVDQLSKLFFQYQLSDRLYLETESGAGQSIDLIYRSQ